MSRPWLRSKVAFWGVVVQGVAAYSEPTTLPLCFASSLGSVTALAIHWFIDRYGVVR